MLRRTYGVFLPLVCMAAFGVTSFAQTAKTITIRMFDSKTARPIANTTFMVRINHQQTVHVDWVRQNDDGLATFTVPVGADVVSIHATYDQSTEIFVNCDSAREKQNPAEHWYSVSTILASGIVAPNGCSKMTETAQPGEFVFFVRKLNLLEQMRN
jgi:hypothetical protein